MQTPGFDAFAAFKSDVENFGKDEEKMNMPKVCVCKFDPDTCRAHRENVIMDDVQKDTITYGYDKDNQRSPLDRIILITEKGGTKYEMPFPSREVWDSEALHYLLSFVDPGEEYTVSFSKKEN